MKYIHYYYEAAHSLPVIFKYQFSQEEAEEMLRECRPDCRGRIFYYGYRMMLIDKSVPLISSMDDYRQLVSSGSV